MGIFPNLAAKNPSLVWARDWEATVQCIIFALLWALTGIPHTVGIQYSSLVLGAVIGALTIARNPSLFLQKEAIPLLAIALLFLWIFFHLFFLARNYELQLDELGVIWKRAALGCFFAVGLSVSLIRSPNTRINRAIIFIGLMSPTIIFYIKYLASLVLPWCGLHSPPELMLYTSSAEFYVPKISYVFFCTPALAVIFGEIVSGFKQNSLAWANFLFLTICLTAIFGLFYLENIKNGIVYSVILLLIAVINIFRAKAISFTFARVLILLIFSIILGFFIVKNVEKNDSWKNVFADGKVAVNSDPFDPKGYIRSGILPFKENGEQVQAANYARLTWLMGGLHLIKDNPFGYGLVQSSFGHLVKERFPETGLGQSHSAWLDMVLGIGIPGASLILLATLLALKNCQKLDDPWKSFGKWFLGSVALILITTEVFQKNYANTFLWMIVFVASLSLASVGTSVRALNLPNTK